jgi:hypothetical protein
MAPDKLQHYELTLQYGARGNVIKDQERRDPNGKKS